MPTKYLKTNIHPDLFGACSLLFVDVIFYLNEKIIIDTKKDNLCQISQMKHFVFSMYHRS